MVLRGYLSEEELVAMEGPILRKQSDPSAPNATRSNYPDMHYLGECPSLATASFGSPRVLAVAEAALGNKAIIGQFGALLTKPVDGRPDRGTAGTQESPGAGTHYDYRPQRVVGSFVHYCFVIVPFTDYIDEAGPIAMSPGSFKQTTVQSSNGRVHPVKCARVPSADEVKLINPCLRRGDLAVMHGFCFHHAMPMNSSFSSVRHGLYMKMRAVDAPPACGPLLIPTAAKNALPPATRHTVGTSSHRTDGSQTIEYVRVVLEDHRGRILVLCPGDRQRGKDVETVVDPSSVELPGCATGIKLSSADADEGRHTWDSSNVIGQATEAVARLLPETGIHWMSWITDHKEDEGTEEETICRVYGHRLSAAATTALSSDDTSSTTNAIWMTVDQLEAAVSAANNGRDREGSSAVLLALACVRMWVLQQDEDGRSVRRGFGVATGDAGAFINWVGDGFDPLFPSCRGLTHCSLLAVGLGGHSFL
eukprot:COSAG02_NODE_1314_length_13316_cov_55.343800_7_plen_478_part_00